MGPELRRVPVFDDARGSLGVIEETDLPFGIARVYYLFDVPQQAVRAEHGHKELQQFVVCMAGRCEMTVHDGARSHVFELTNPREGLYIPRRMWRSLRFLEPGTVCCVFASMAYDRADYLETFEEFTAFVSRKRVAEPVR